MDTWTCASRWRWKEKKCCIVLSITIFYFKAFSHLCKKVCLSVSPSVHTSDRPSIGPSVGHAIGHSVGPVCHVCQNCQNKQFWAIRGLWAVPSTLLLTNRSQPLPKRSRPLPNTSRIWCSCIQTCFISDSIFKVSFCILKFWRGLNLKWS